MEFAILFGFVNTFFIFQDIGLLGLPVANLHRLVHLSELHLCNNRLRYLPYTMIKHSHLRLLELSNNPFLKLDAFHSSSETSE
ncbi:unnamed protein product, partial [Protopolystoma xenopodis]